jgi:hypothetical protein
MRGGILPRPTPAQPPTLPLPRPGTNFTAKWRPPPTPACGSPVAHRTSGSEWPPVRLNSTWQPPIAAATCAPGMDQCQSLSVIRLGPGVPPDRRLGADRMAGLCDAMGVQISQFCRPVRGPRIWLFVLAIRPCVAAPAAVTRWVSGYLLELIAQVQAHVAERGEGAEQLGGNPGAERQGGGPGSIEGLGRLEAVQPWAGALQLGGVVDGPSTSWLRSRVPPG